MKKRGRLIVLCGLVVSILIGGMSVYASSNEVTEKVFILEAHPIDSVDSFENQIKYFKDDITDEEFVVARAIYSDYVELRKNGDDEEANLKWKEYRALDIFAPIEMTAMPSAEEISNTVDSVPKTQMEEIENN